MTVAQLIEKLKTMPKSYPVVTEGYEMGYDAIKTVSTIQIAKTKKPEWYTGQFDDPNKGEPGTPAVYLYAATRADPENYEELENL